MGLPEIGCSAITVRFLVLHLHTGFVSGRCPPFSGDATGLSRTQLHPEPQACQVPKAVDTGKKRKRGRIT
jgi:hypothetical protein